MVKHRDTEGYTDWRQCKYQSVSRDRHRRRHYALNLLMPWFFIAVARTWGAVT